MTFLDASFLIGFADARDKWHDRAVALRPRVRRPLTTDLVLAEAVSVIGARRGGKEARTLFRFLEDTCQVEFLDRASLPQVMEEHLRYDGGLSVADCFSIVMMKASGTHEIASFDDDFDKVAGIARLH